MSDVIRLVASFVIGVAIASAAATLYTVATVEVPQEARYNEATPLLPFSELILQNVLDVAFHIFRQT